MKFKKAILFANLHARQVRRLIDEATSCLEAAGISLIRCKFDARSIDAAIAEHKDSVDIAIVAGGDGTLNAVIDQVVASGLPLAILPLGTANDLARTLDIPCDVAGACRLLSSGSLKEVDLGKVNGKHFFNVASLGISVSITRELSKDLKKRFGPLAYCLASLRVLWGYRPFHAEIHVDGRVIKVKTTQIAVGNGHFYGGGMQIAHDAVIDDQHLNAYSLEVDHWWQLFGMVRALRSGHLSEHPYIRTLRSRSISVLTEKKRHINTDGEITSATPAVFQVVPRAIKVLVPSAIGGSGHQDS